MPYYLRKKSTPDSMLMWLVEDPFTYMFFFGETGISEQTSYRISQEILPILGECPKVIVTSNARFAILLFAMEAIPYKSGDVFVLVSTMRKDNDPQILDEALSEMNVLFDSRCHPSIRKTACNDLDNKQFVKNRQYEYVGDIPPEIRKKLITQRILNKIYEACKEKMHLRSSDMLTVKHDFMMRLVQNLFDYLDDFGKTWNISDALDFSWYHMRNSLKKNENNCDWRYSICQSYQMYNCPEIANDEMTRTIIDIVTLFMEILCQNYEDIEDIVLNKGGIYTAFERVEEYGFRSIVETYLAGVPVEDIIA